MSEESEEIDYEAIPGTSHLIDVQGDHSTEEENGKGIILIPKPSEDPNDPLNWSKKRKWIQVFCLILYCYGGGIASCSQYSLLEAIAADPGTHVTVNDEDSGTGYNFLFLGLGQFLMTPFAQQCGKRPAYLLSTFGNMMFCLWLPFVHSNGQCIASQILSGLFYAPIESLPSVTITDMFFEHERGTYIGIYSVALGTSNFMAPMLSGFVADAIGWKWAIYIAIIFDAVCFIAMCFLVEETNYERKYVIDTVAATEQKLTNKTVENGITIKTVTSGNDHLANQASVIISHEEQHYPSTKSYWQRLSLTGGVRKENHFFDYIMMIVYMFQFPPVLWSGFLYGASLFFYSIINTTETIILSGDPYNFSTSMLGLAYLSPVIFVLLFYPIAGSLIDWLKIWKAKKHNGVSQAEDRLPVLFLFMILGPASLILYGVGAAHNINWFGVVFGMGMMSGFSIVGTTSSITYTLDCYPQMGMPAMAVVILLRNLANFAVDYGIVPFIDNCGIQTTYIACAFICFGCIGSYIVMEKTGFYWRKRLRKRYWNLVAKYREKGIL